MHFKVAEGMGWEIVEEEVPISYAELSEECQYALELFNSLPDKVDSMAGIWLGKDYAGLGDVIDLIGVPNELKSEVFYLLQVIISEYSKYYEDKRKAAESQANIKAKMK